MLHFGNASLDSHVISPPPPNWRAEGSVFAFPRKCGMVADVKRRIFS